MVTQTQLVNKRLTEEGVCPWRFIYKWLLDKWLFPATWDHIISRQQCMCVVHTWAHKASRHFPYCSTFTVFPCVLFRIDFISIQNFTLLHRNLFTALLKTYTQITEVLCKLEASKLMVIFTFLLESLVSVGSCIIKYYIFFNVALDPCHPQYLEIKIFFHPTLAWNFPQQEMHLQMQVRLFPHQ